MSALEFIGENIAKGALSEIGGDAAGWALGAIFGGSSGPSNQDVLDAVNKLGIQLSAIQSSLTALRQDVDAHFQQISKALNKINKQILYNAWSSTNTTAFLLVNQINTQYQTLLQYAIAAKTTSKGQVSQLVKEIQDTNTGAKVSLNALNGLIMGVGGAKGLLELWLEMVTPLLQSGAAGVELIRQRYMDYYTQLIGAQMKACHLLIEAFNQQGNNPVSQMEYRNFRDLMTAQETVFLPILERVLYTAFAEGGLWNTVNTTGKIVVIVPKNGYLPGVKELYAGSRNGTSVYTPTVWRAQAEQLLSYAQSQKPGERCISVWSIYEPYLSSNLGDTSLPTPPQQFDNATVQICAVGSPRQPISPDSVITLVTEADYSIGRQVPSAAPLPRTNKKRIVRRHLFRKISDGTYRLFDANGQYPPVSTSGYALEFATERLYLSYSLTVGQGDSLAFMDFAIYPYVSMDYYG
jgi:hypothetical protein